MGFETLPSELIIDILSRTSLETLEQCKLVCKNWKEIVYEPTFLRRYCQRRNSALGYFFHNLKSISKYPSALESSSSTKAATPPPFDDCLEIIASCDQGIVICKRRFETRPFYACMPPNPTSQQQWQWETLPNPDIRYRTVGVGVVVVRSRPLRYIIARLYRYWWSDGWLEYGCEIFDSEIRRWESVESMPRYRTRVRPWSDASSTAGRFLHWFTRDCNEVLTLDVEKRCFQCTRVPLALGVGGFCRWRQVVEYEGGLGFMCLLIQGDGSYRLELYGAEERKIVVDMRELGTYLEHPLPMEFCHGDGDLVFMRTADGGGLYNLKNCSLISKMEVPSSF